MKPKTRSWWHRLPACALLLTSALIVSPMAAAQMQSATPASTAAPEATPPATGPALQVDVIGFRTDAGRVSCMLYNDPKTYPRGKEIRQIWAPIKNGKALCVFTDVPAGKYAMVVYHDQNSNGQFDMNAFSMPLEGYGFSNDAAALFDAPSFKDASFDYDGKRLYTVITMRY
jgi:uncharacterized protein (DUF2141 family)